MSKVSETQQLQQQSVQHGSLPLLTAAACPMQKLKQKIDLEDYTNKPVPRPEDE